MALRLTRGWQDQELAQIDGNAPANIKQPQLDVCSVLWRQKFIALALAPELGEHRGLQATRMATILITAFVVLIVGYMILYGLWWIFLWLTEYDGLYYLTIVFGLGCIAIVVILIVWSARHLFGVTS